MDNAMLAEIFQEIEASDIQSDISGYTDAEMQGIFSGLDFETEDENPLTESEQQETISIADKFIFAPTSVLNARQGDWTDRKSEWLKIGIKSELGRGENLTFKSAGIADPSFYEDKQKLEKQLGRTLTTKEFEEQYYDKGDRVDNGTSIFDPVLCELCYKWFSSQGANILDPFSGGSVRGVVAALSGRSYTGIDLREEQIKENQTQWSSISARWKSEDNTQPQWLAGDSLAVLPTITDEFDMVFSCPPYADLEKYSDSPADLSNMDYDDFLKAYNEIIRLAAERLKNDRFAAFVVGEIRDKKGIYRNFVGDTVKAFQAAGLQYYNEMVLVTPISGLRFRLSRQFAAGRKVGKTHQNILVFVKGDPKKATKYCGEVEVSMPDLDEEI